MNEQGPVARPVALHALLRCLAESARLLAGHRVRLPKEHVGTRLRFADGTSAHVYRETRVTGRITHAPCTLAVTFRLRLVHGAGHTVFRVESLLNTPLFVGFPGFVSKLWLAHDEQGRYRGLYEWDGPERAETYARCLWRVLELVCVPGSIRYTVLPGMPRDQVVPGHGADGNRPHRDDASVRGKDADAPADDWWRRVPA